MEGEELKKKIDKERIYGTLKPRAASFGFTKEELLTVCDAIAERLAGLEGTDEEIDAAVTAEVDAAVPFLRLSQSAAARLVRTDRTGAGSSYDNTARRNARRDDGVPTGSGDDDASGDDDGDSSGATDDDGGKDVPKWARRLIRDNRKLSDEIQALKTERIDAGFRKSVSEGLKGIDASFYTLALDGRKFSSQDEADDFVDKVRSSYKEFSKSMNIDELSRIVPPKGGRADSPKEAAAEVKARAEARAKAAEADAGYSPIAG